jgi:hypothetical protein
MYIYIYIYILVFIRFRLEKPTIIGFFGKRGGQQGGKGTTG